jgi:hypothetical protein
MKLWYYGRADQQFGPVDEQTLRGKIASGEVMADSLVWCEGMGDWQPLAGVSELQQPMMEDGTYAAAIGQQGASGAHPGYQQQPQPCGLAIASMVCGIASIVMLVCYLIGALPGIAAVICGHMAMKKIRQAPHAVAGHGMALTGLITGYCSIFITAAGLIWLGVFFAQLWRL